MDGWDIVRAVVVLVLLAGSVVLVFAWVADVARRRVLRWWRIDELCDHLASIDQSLRVRLMYLDRPTRRAGEPHE